MMCPDASVDIFLIETEHPPNTSMKCFENIYTYNFIGVCGVFFNQLCINANISQERLIGGCKRQWENYV